MSADVYASPQVSRAAAVAVRRTTQTRYLLVLTSLAIAAGSGVGAAVGQFHRNATTRVPPAQPLIRTFVASSMRTFYASREIKAAPVTVDRFSFLGHGGAAVIEWYCGAWSPLTSPATEVVALYLDGNVLVDSVFGGKGGEYDTRAGVLRWVGPLPPGAHVVSIRLRRATGPLAMPIVVGGGPVQEGVSVTEHVRG